MSYLRHIQLSKQLEEKAKEATKFRQLAEKELKEAEEGIEESRKIDASIAEAEAAFTEANEAMKGKDYKLALEKATLSKEKAKRAYTERVQTIVDSSAVLLDLARNIGANVSAVESLTRDAKEAFSKDQLKEAIDYAKKSWEKSEKILHEHLSESFSSAQSMIMAAKKVGKDTSVFEDLLSRARQAGEDNDYETAMNYMNECIESVSGELKEDIQSLMGEAKAMIDISKELGADASKVEGIMERATIELERKEFEKALNSSRQSRTEAEKVLHRGVEKGIQKVEDMLKEAEKIEVDISKGKGLLEEVRKAVDKGNFSKSAQLIRKSIEEVENAQFQKVLSTISKSRPKFVTARNIGADISAAMNLLNEARKALREGKYNQALEFALQGDSEVDKIVKEFQSIEEDIASLQKELIKAEEKGVDASGARSFLKRAQIAIKTRDFPRVSKLVKDAREELERAQYERTMELIEAAEIDLTSGEKMGANLEEADVLLEECVVLTKSKKYSRAMELAIECRRVTTEQMEKHLGDIISNLHQSVEKLGKEGIATRKLLDKAESALAIDDFGKAYELANEAKSVLGEAFSKKGVELLQSLQSAVELGESMEYDISPLSKRLEDVEATVSAGEFEDLVSVTEEVSAIVEDLVDKAFTFIRDKVVEARKIGLDIGEMTRLLKDAKIAVGTEDYSKSLQSLVQCNRMVDSLLEKHNATYEAISSSAALVGEARKKKLDISRTLKILLAAKKAFEAFEYDKALELANRSRKEAEELMMLYEAAESISEANDNVEFAKGLGFKIGELNGTVKDAKSAIKDKKYQAALRLSQKSLEGSRNLLREGISNLISTTRSQCKEAEKEIVDTENVMNTLDEAKSLLERDEFKDAASLAESAKESFQQLKDLSQRASEALKNAKSLFAEIEGMNVQAPKSKKLLQEAKSALESGLFERAIETAEKCVEEIETERDGYISKTIESFLDVIRKAKREGVNTRSAETLIAQAKNHFRNGEYKKALEMAMKSESEVERVGLQQDMATKAILTAKKKMEGFPVPVRAAHKLIEEAEKHLEKGNYVDALEKALRSGDEFHRAVELYEVAKRSLDQANQIAKTVEHLGEDKNEIEKILDNAKSAMESGNLDVAKSATDQAYDWGIGICESALRKRMSNIDSSLTVSEEIGIDSSQTRQKVSEARALVENQDFEGAYALVQEAEDQVDHNLGGFVSQVIDNSKSAVNYAKKIGAGVGESQKLLSKAEKMLAKRNYGKALELAEKSIGIVESTRKLEKEFIDLTYQTDTIIGSAKRFGIDVSDAEKSLLQALEMKKKNIKQAMGLARKSYDVASSAIDGFAPCVKGAIDVLKAKMGEWIDSQLTLKNEGKTLAKDIEVTILGDAEAEGLVPVPMLRAGGTHTIHIRLRMTAAGTVPLAIQVTSHRIFDDKEFVEESVAQVNVSKPEGEVEKEIIKRVAEKVSKCSICKGKIKKGFPEVLCVCGETFHESCAKREGKCPKCGKSLL